jgi:SAM-dependent methyltransferase
MTSEANIHSPNWFDAGGSDYAKFRPEYPEALAQFLASISTNKQLAVDVGCGNGQLAVQLAAHFHQVIGMDPSEDQINHAKSAPGVTYVNAPAEALPVADHSAGLITAAQAAHWFNLPAFFKEVRRVASQDAVIALISYGVLNLEPELNERFKQFYWQEIGPYWPPERTLVDTGYADIAFPFNEAPAPCIAMEKIWNLDELLGYISTWSAVKRAAKNGRTSLLTTFADDLTALWGNRERKRTVTWPINMRIGKL